MSTPTARAGAEQLAKDLGYCCDGKYWTWDWGRAEKIILAYADEIRREERARLEVEPRFLLHVPQWKREGIDPEPAHKPCLYTLIRSCREQSDDPDRWCGFCSETNAIPVIKISADQAEGTEE